MAQGALAFKYEKEKKICFYVYKKDFQPFKTAFPVLLGPFLFIISKIV